MDENVIETEGDLRVRLVLDETPEEPYDDGSSPLLRFDHRRTFDTWQVEQVKRTSYDVPGSILAAARKWGPGEVFIRYLAIYHGMTCHDDYATSDYDYLTFDTAAWREAMALTDAYLDEHPDVRGTLANLDEWRCYCEGDTYGWVIEQRVTWKRDDDPTQTRETWEEVESCWGYYGREDGEQAARQNLAEHTKG